MSLGKHRSYYILALIELAIIVYFGVVVGNRLAQVREPIVLISGPTMSGEPAPEHAPEQPKRSTMLFVGDSMFDRYVRRFIEREQDPLFPFLLIASTTRSADFTFGNLEGPISDRGLNQGSKYSFRFEPTGTIHALTYAGFDVVNLANNHILDYGFEAAADTMAHLSAATIEYIGYGQNAIEASTPVIKMVGAARVALLGYTSFYSENARAGEVRGGLSELQPEAISRRIRQIKQDGLADIIVVSMHWGEEYETRSNSYQRELAHQLVDAGANLVIGHHPHVVQEIERYRGAYIVYSLGNFVFDQNFSADTRRGLMVEVVIEGTTIAELKELPILFTKEYQPYPAQ